MPDLTGQSIGRYRILEPLGEGGMATVYKAYDTRLERDVAVKVIRRGAFPPDALDRILKRFEREAKALARLTHPNIVPVIDFGDHEGSPYLVMPFLPGGTLKEKMGAAIGWQDAFRLVIPVAQALDYAHEQQILHRDVKPSNILLTQRGQPLLTDFGIAKILDLEEGHTLTGTGVGVGTPEYMSPEQSLGRQVGPGTDVYSLGIVLYEMVTGRKPYTADTPMAVVDKHLHDPLPRPMQFVRELPDVVEKVLIKALAKDPEDRFKDMNEFTQAMEKLLAGSGQIQSTRSTEKADAGSLRTFGKGQVVDDQVTIDHDKEDTQATFVQDKDTKDGPSTMGVNKFGTPSVGTQGEDQEGIPSQPLAKRKTGWRWVIWFGGILVLGLIFSGIGFIFGGDGKPEPTLITSQTLTDTISRTSTFTQISTSTHTFTPSITITPLTILGLEGTWYKLTDGWPPIFVSTVELLEEKYVVTSCGDLFGGRSGYYVAYTNWDPSTQRLTWGCQKYSNIINDWYTISLNADGLIVGFSSQWVGGDIFDSGIYLLERQP